MEQFDLMLFDLSPIAMWLQDFSGVKKIFQQWADEGVVDFEAYLLEDLTRLQQCLMTIQTQRINSSALKLYEARDLDHILENFIRFLTPGVTHSQIKFFCALWRGERKYRVTLVNYTCTGKAIDIQLSANVVEGYEDTWGQLLLTTENISDFQNARRFAESLLLHSPTPLWVKDYSGVKKRFDQIRQQGVVRLDYYIKEHPKFVEECYESIRSVSVNQAFLRLFKVENLDTAHFVQEAKQIFVLNNQKNFYDQLLLLWEGHQQLQRECEYQILDGSRLFILEKFNIFPDAKDNWDTIQVAYTDFTERKKLEDHLNYVSRYDQLTRLHNRTFFNEEIERLYTQAIYPISCIYMDVNGLKVVNDKQGHHYGDILLQRFAKILIEATQNIDCSVSRIGGDEFVILMPFAIEYEAQQLIQKIEELLANEDAKDAKITVSSGFASVNSHQSVEKLVKKADQNMYKEKKNFYKLLSS